MALLCSKPGCHEWHSGATLTDADWLEVSQMPWADDIGTGVVVLASAPTSSQDFRGGNLVLGGRQEAEQLPRGSYGLVINCSGFRNINYPQRCIPLEKETNTCSPLV